MSAPRRSSSDPIRVLAWSEWSEPAEVYPAGIHGELAGYLNGVGGIVAETAQLSDAEQGITEEALGKTDVLLWFGHVRHHLVSDETAQRVARWVRKGKGFVPLHSAHLSKPFQVTLECSGSISGWRDDQTVRVEVRAPEHPIAEGVADFNIPCDEMYSEPFGIPEPETLVFYSYFGGGEEFRSGCAWTVGKGRVFYFQPGHETLPVFRQQEIRKVLVNAVRWAAHRT